MLIKSLIFLNLILILISLLSGMFFLAKKDNSDSKGKNLVTSLTLRVCLSFSLILLVLFGYFIGVLQPHGV